MDNFFVVECTYSSGVFFTEGKKYVVQNGVITTDSGVGITENIHNVDELNLLFSSKFRKVEMIWLN